MKKKTSKNHLNSQQTTFYTYTQKKQYKNEHTKNTKIQIKTYNKPKRKKKTRKKKKRKKLKYTIQKLNWSLPIQNTKNLEQNVKKINQKLIMNFSS